MKRTQLPENLIPLLGRLSDAEIARRVGMSTKWATLERKRRGIPAGMGRDLDVIGPEETLRRIRARARSGAAMHAGKTSAIKLVCLARRHFGSWYGAVEAAGLKPLGKPRIEVQRPATKQVITDALLKGPKTAAELEMLTGVPRWVIRRRRWKIGIIRKEQSDASWVKTAQGLFGRLPDAEIASRVGRSVTAVRAARNKAGIPRIANHQVALTERDLRGLTFTEVQILRLRHMRKPALTLNAVAERLQIPRSTVSLCEKRVLARIEERRTSPTASRRQKAVGGAKPRRAAMKNARDQK